MLLSRFSETAPSCLRITWSSPKPQHETWRATCISSRNAKPLIHSRKGNTWRKQNKPPVVGSDPVPWISWVPGMWLNLCRILYLLTLMTGSVNKAAASAELVFMGQLSQSLFHITPHSTPLQKPYTPDTDYSSADCPAPGSVPGPLNDGCVGIKHRIPAVWRLQLLDPNSKRNRTLWRVWTPLKLPQAQSETVVLLQAPCPAHICFHSSIDLWSHRTLLYRRHTL